MSEIELNPLLLYTYDREQSPTENGMYECLVHDHEGGPWLYIEMVEFKDGGWQDFAEVVGWRAKS